MDWIGGIEKNNVCVIKYYFMNINIYITENMIGILTK